MSNFICHFFCFVDNQDKQDIMALSKKFCFRKTVHKFGALEIRHLGNLASMKAPVDHTAL